MHMTRLPPLPEEPLSPPEPASPAGVIDTSKHTRECWCVYCERAGTGVFADLRPRDRSSGACKGKKKGRT